MKQKPEISDTEEYLRFLKSEKDISDLIINHSRSMITIINRDYVYEKVNSAFCNQQNVMPGSIPGMSLGEVWGMDTFLNKIKPNTDKCFSGKTVRYKAVISTPKSGKRLFEVVFRPLSLKQGEITHLLAETFDINDLDDAQKTIREKEDEIKKFESTLPIGFLRCDPDGQIIRVNEAFRTITGSFDPNIISLNFKDFYFEKDLFKIHKNLLIENHIKNFGLVSLKNIAEKEIPCRVSAFMAVKESSDPAYIDFAIEDCSRELMLEDRLRQSQKLETIGSLAGGIAHDFNNILAVISGYSEMLNDDLPDYADLREKVAKIQGAVKKAQSITNQILTFSRHVDQEKVLVDVSEVLRETVGFVRLTIPANINLDFNIPCHKANILADPTQLFRVFLNLMKNAFQAMEKNGGKLTINLDSKGKLEVEHDLNKNVNAENFIVVSFADKGEGMDQSTLSRIFEPFFTTREVGKGTGLGLSVIHGIITEMQGEISVMSKIAEGSVFTIYLPVAETGENFKAEDKMHQKVLFISGNIHESRILSLAIESAGYDLIYANTKSDLADILTSSNDNPDVVIYMYDSEHILPEQLAYIYVKQKINIPLILITDLDQGNSDNKLINLGIKYKIITKPVSLRDIIDAIRD